MSKLKQLAGYASWNYGAQLVTIVAQFGYAAVTTRLVDDTGFGQYAVAMSVAALITLIANGGLGSTAGRMDQLQPRRVSALALYGLMLGAAGAAILLLTADWWSALWGSPAAADAVRFLGISVFVAPLAGFSSGLLRRTGRFKILSITVVLSNLAGMALGLVAVIQFPGSVTLLVSTVAATLIQVLTFSLLNIRLFWGRPSFSAARGDLFFSGMVMALSLVSYLNGNIARWAVSRGVGVDVFGQWNRADVLTAVPMQQVQVAFSQAIYPEFRHDMTANERTKRVWTDMLTMIAWFALPLASLVAVAAPIAIPILFGPGWGFAAQLSIPLAFISGLQMIVTTLGAALEATARFKWIVTTHLLVLSFMIGGAVLSVSQRSVVPAVASMFIATLIQHSVQVWFSSRAGFLDAKNLLKNYAGSVSFAIFLFLSLNVLVHHFEETLAWQIITFVLGVATVASAVFIFRKRLPIIKVFQKYLQ